MNFIYIHNIYIILILYLKYNLINFTLKKLNIKIYLEITKVSIL